MNKREQRRRAVELLRQAPAGVIYTLAEAMELVEFGAPWNMAWYIKGRETTVQQVLKLIITKC